MLIVLVVLAVPYPSPCSHSPPLHPAFPAVFSCTLDIAASLLDMEWNSITTEGDLDVEAFEKAAMDKYGLIPEIKPRYRTTYFSHVFDGGYAAGYYVYLWAEVLDADTFNAFKASGDIYNQELATKFRKYVLSEGGYADPMSQYIKFRGETPTEDALLQKRGLK